MKQIQRKWSDFISINHGYNGLISVFQYKKHMVEKRRRGRINDSLEMMKSIILHSMNKNVSKSIFNKNIKLVNKVR